MLMSDDESDRLRDVTRRAKNEDPLLSGLREESFDPRSTAVVVIDMINHQLNPKCAIGMYERIGLPTEYLLDRVQSVVIPNHQRLLAAARASGATVAYLRMGSFRPDASDASPSLAPMLREWRAQDGQWACEVIDEIKPVDGDISLIKTGSGSFGTSALDNHLRNIGIENVLYTGVLTNACVMLTIAAGFDLGYHNYLVTDATATQTHHWQEQAEELIGLYLASNVTTEQCIARFEAVS
jgi:nicotinamidase-related amidase